MRKLSFAVALLAVVALVTGQQSGNAGTIGMGVVGALLAAALYRSTGQVTASCGASHNRPHRDELAFARKANQITLDEAEATAHVVCPANGCVLEIGRKLWAPESEREGVETYSRVLGPERGAVLWLGCLAAAFALLLAVGWATGAPWLTGAIGLAALAYAARAALLYRAGATPERAKALEDASGLWVFACYGGAGFAPFAGSLFG